MSSHHIDITGDLCCWRHEIIISLVISLWILCSSWLNSFYSWKKFVHLQTLRYLSNWLIRVRSTWWRVWEDRKYWDGNISEDDHNSSENNGLQSLQETTNDQIGGNSDEEERSEDEEVGTRESVKRGVENLLECCLDQRSADCREQSHEWEDATNLISRHCSTDDRSEIN